MVSLYLQREVRDRVTIARDLAIKMAGDVDTLSTLADGLDVMFATTVTDPASGKPVFSYVSNSAYHLTGYWPSELEGRDPASLQADATNKREAQRFMQTLATDGIAETRILNQHKNGDLYGCAISAYRAYSPGSAPNAVYHAFLASCPASLCH